MPTILRIKGYRFFFNSREENRRHVHVATADGNAKFWIWLASTQREYFVPFNDYPAFKAATVAQILNMKYLPPSQLSWEELDIDIELDALIHPEAFPLSYKTLLA